MGTERAAGEPAAPGEWVRYDKLTRKETRVRPDQYDSLTHIARDLNRHRHGGDRITENTLIRVAIDLLVGRAAELAGTTEAELRASLGL